MLMRLDEMIEDHAAFPRSGINELLIHEYAEAMKAGAAFPPIEVYESTHHIRDGFHRRRAAKAAGLEAFEVVLCPEPAGLDDKLAQAVRANNRHGLRFTRYDYRRIAMKFEEWGWTPERTAEVLEIPPVQVGELLQTRAADRKGGAVALKSGLAHLIGSTLTDDQVRAVGSYQGAPMKYYAHTLLEAVEQELVDVGDRAFRLKMDDLVFAWERWKAARGFAAIRHA